MLHFGVLVVVDFVLNYIEYTHSDKGYYAFQSFLFESYAPVVFATIRRAVSVSEKNYNEAIMSRNQPFLEFLSNSRSGQDFFLRCEAEILSNSIVYLTSCMCACVCVCVCAYMCVYVCVCV